MHREVLVDFLEIRERRNGLGYSIGMLADVLRVEPRELRDWENGSVAIPDWIAVSIDALRTARANPIEELIASDGTFTSRQNRLLWAKVRDSLTAREAERKFDGR